MRSNRGGVALVAIALVLGACSGSDEATAPEDSSASGEPSPSPAPRCPLSGEVAPEGVDVTRPAVAVKIENNPVAYPLAGLEDAEVVYEELVEGGQTRFMALYHCTDAVKAGPIRSTRSVDPAILGDTTKILAGAGGNAIVRKILKKADVVIIDEEKAKKAMERIPREGIASEHTLYGDTAALRELGSRRFDEPPGDLFSFGDLDGKAKKAKTITITFSPSVTVSFAWTGERWARSDRGNPLTAESGDQIKVDNVIIEQHTVNNSTKLFDVAGNPSIEIVDESGSGPAVIFRDGKAIKGKWVRDEDTGRMSYQTKTGEEIPLSPGVTWIELVPNKKGELKGSFTFTK
ncbi:MAG: DUF3048 domain-containing protein [Actinomycetota bacterium]|nr:DUF3048 domain-containing protein [Actinomycetota bacterium]